MQLYAKVNLNTLVLKSLKRVVYKGYFAVEDINSVLNRLKRNNMLRARYSQKEKFALLVHLYD